MHWNSWTSYADSRSSFATATDKNTRAGLRGAVSQSRTNVHCSIFLSRLGRNRSLVVPTYQVGSSIYVAATATSRQLLSCTTTARPTTKQQRLIVGDSRKNCRSRCTHDTVLVVPGHIICFLLPRAMD